MSLDQESRRRYGRYGDAYDGRYDGRNKASPRRREQRNGRGPRDSGNHYRQYADLGKSPRPRARSRSRYGRSCSIESSSSVEETEHFRPPVVRRGQHKERAVYIKKRHILGIDMDFEEALKPTPKPKKGSKKERKKERPFWVSDLDEIARDVASFALQGQHWAVEIGPWTIELGKDPETMKKPTVTVTHNDNLDPSWEKELDRIQVGSSTLSDAQLMYPERFIGGHPQKYSVVPVNDPENWRSVPRYANCQLIAAKIAIFIADNPWEAYDKLNADLVWHSTFLDAEQVYDYLACLHPDSSSSIRCLARGFSLWLRKVAADEHDEEEANNSFSRFLSSSHEKFESHIISQLRYV